MNAKPTLFTAITLGSFTVMTACARTPEAPGGNAPATAMQPAQTSPATANTNTAKPSQRADATLPRMVVHKSASCGCCALWVKHLRDAGFQIEIRNQNNLNPIKERVGVPIGKGSCHTAKSAAISSKVICRPRTSSACWRNSPMPRDRPAGHARRSPGMELPDGMTQPYTVELVQRGGTTNAFAQH